MNLLRKSLINAVKTVDTEYVTKIFGITKQQLIQNIVNGTITMNKVEFLIHELNIDSQKLFSRFHGNNNIVQTGSTNIYIRTFINK